MDRSFCKTVNYSHVESLNTLNIHSVYNKILNRFGRRGYHCVSQHPPIDGWHQNDEVEQAPAKVLGLGVRRGQMSAFNHLLRELPGENLPLYPSVHISSI